MQDYSYIYLFHIFCIGPFLIYVGYNKNNIPEYIYNIFIVAGILVIIYHSYLLYWYRKTKENYDNNVNILGTSLVPCGSNTKVTGFYRDGQCITGPADKGTHIVCAVVDDNFLQFTKSKGNDLITPRNNFPGLVAGDQWCLCILRWIEAYKAGKAPKIIPESTNSKVSEYISTDILLKYAMN
jgi:uncharacterized protein (DUF2237 family)